MSNVTLVVGKTYRMRDGKLVRIVEETKLGFAHWNPVHKFVGSNGVLYRANGRSGILSVMNTDIVEESTNVRLQAVGGTWIEWDSTPQPRFG